MAKPRTGVFVAALQADLVLLDVASDRYIAVCDAVETSLSDPTKQAGLRLSASGERALLDAGLFIPGDEPLAARQPDLRDHPCRSDRTLGRVRPRDVVHLVLAIGGMAARLARRRPCSSYERVGDAAHDAPWDARTASALGALRSMRLAVPLPTRCLPASLVTCLFLRRKGVDSRLVFGVRSHPFEAHCWVEQGGAVVDDDVDRLRAFTPIATGRP